MDMNKKKYELVIFDLDGTLLDTSEGILNSVKYTIEQLGYPEPSKEVLYSFVGPRIQDSLQEHYGLHGEILNNASKIFRDRYKQGDVLLAKPYNGVYDLLNELKLRGIHIAVATNKRQDFADAVLKKYGFEEYVELVCGTDMQGILSKNDLLYNCISFFNLSGKDTVVMVGDSSYDARAAQEVGIDFIGVRYGFEFVSKCDVNQWKNVGNASSVSDIINYVKGEKI